MMNNWYIRNADNSVTMLPVGTTCTTTVDVRDIVAVAYWKMGRLPYCGWRR